MKGSYDAKHSLTQYTSGDLVMYATDSGQLNVTPKLRVNFQGPYLVLDRLGDLDYWVQLDARGTQKIVPHDKLKPYVGEHILPWAKSVLRANKAKTKWGPLVHRIQDGKMRVRASSCSPCRMTYKCGTCDYARRLYHEMCTHVLKNTI